MIPKPNRPTHLLALMDQLVWLISLLPLEVGKILENFLLYEIRAVIAAQNIIPDL